MRALLLVRHAHRDTSNRGLDNGLSLKGQKQANALARYFDKLGSRKRETLLLSSPKLRCRETIQGLEKAANTSVETLDLLDEQGPRETTGEFQRRVRSLCRWWARENIDLTVCCTHGDWIPAAMRILFGLEIELKKGGIILIERTLKQNQIVEIRQQLR